MRVVLAGGAGTLGGDIANLLSDRYQFLVIDDFQESNTDREWLAERLPVLEADLADLTTFEQDLVDFEPEAIVYLATTVSQDQRRGLNTVIGLRNLLDYGTRIGNPRVLYIQSFLTRDVSAPIRSDAPLLARDPYSVWKLAGELLLDSYLGESSSVVLSSVISPRLNVGAIPAFVRRISNNQPLQVTSTARDYLHPKDFCTALEFLLTLPNLPKKTVVGSGEAISTHNIALAVAEAMGVELDTGTIAVVEPRISDPSSVILDPEEFRSWSQWSASYAIHDAIYECVREIRHSQREIRLHH